MYRQHDGILGGPKSQLRWWNECGNARCRCNGSGASVVRTVSEHAEVDVLFEDFYCVASLYYEYI